jgi:predicted ATP-dependent serine protease
LTAAEKSGWSCFNCCAQVEAIDPDPCDCGTPDSWVRTLPSSTAPTRRARAAVDVPPDTTPRLPTATELDQVLRGGGLAETSCTLIFGPDGKGKSRAALRIVGALQSSLFISLEMPIELAVDTARHAGADLRGMDVVDELDGWEREAEGKRAILLDSISVTGRGWSGLLERFRKWATTTRGLVIIIAQVNARGRVLGPNALRHWPDYVIRASGGSSLGRVLLTIQKSRYTAPASAELAIVKQ